MKFLLAVLLMSLAVTFAANSADDDNHWNSYKGAFKKNHHPRDEARRKANFLARHKKIEEHNRGKHSFKKGTNHLSDLSQEERAALLGAKLPSQIDFVESAQIAVDERALPASIDYRNNSCLNPVKDQGQCGSCWSFASLAPIEFNKCKLTGKNLILSEQMLVDCDTAGYNYGCDGGFYTNAWSFLKSKGGAMTSASYPYVSGPSGLAGTTCKFNSVNVGVKVSNYARVSNTTAAIMAALQTYGPLSAALQVVDALYDYASGVYSEPLCKGIANDVINHAVVIVGYGTSGTDDYWVVRNSWSSSWGINGYFLIKRGVNMCNIENYAAYVTVI